MTDPGPKKRWPLFATLVALVILALLGAFLLGRRRPNMGGPNGSGFPVVSTTSVGGIPSTPTEPTALDVEAAAPPMLSAFVDVLHPPAVRDAVRHNAWFQAQLAQPLGQGFIGPWAGFLGSRGEDLKATFKGEVATFLADELLQDPLRIGWYSLDGRPAIPVVIVPHPGAKAKAAFEALDRVANHGTQTAQGCPGVKPAGTAKAWRLNRWLLAEQNVFAALYEDRLVLSRQPRGVLFALCDALPTLAIREGTDLELGLPTAGAGREVQTLAAVLGLGDTVRLGLSAAKASLTPTGIFAEVKREDRLASAAFSDKALHAIPEDVPVVLTLQAKLPSALTSDALKMFWLGKSVGELKTRQVAVLWEPRGIGKTSDVAVLWSDPADQAQLQQIFSGSNKLTVRTVCEQLVLASSEAMVARLERACASGSPSLLQSSPAVVAGMKQPTSMALGIHLGHVLARLTRDGWERPGKDLTPPPPDVEAAAQALEELPFMGFRATEDKAKLVPGGFKS